MRLGLGLSLDYRGSLGSKNRGPAPVPLQIAGSRGEINAIEGNAIVTSNQLQTGRSRHYLGTQDLSEIIIGFNGFFVDTATAGNGLTCAELDASNSYILRLALEINGVTRRVTFKGSPDGLVVAGSLLYLADPILPSAFGLTKFTAQTEIWVRAEREFAIGQKAMFHQTAANAPAITGERYMVAPLGSASQLMGTGDLVVSNGWVAQAHVWLPYVILGRPLQAMMSVITFGASIENGVGDGQGDGLNGAGGYMRRMLANVNGKKIARLHLAKSGETIKSWVNNSAKRRHMLKYCTHVMSGHGGNDYSTGESLANTQLRWTQAWALMKATGAWVEHYALSPKTDSTNAWADLAAQTPRVGFATGGAWRDAGNTWCASQVGVDPNLNAFVNLGDVQTPSSNRDKWRVDLGQPTVDGTHPTYRITEVMAVANVLRMEALRSVCEDLISANWTPLALGAKLLAWWDINRVDLITLAGSSITSWKDSKNGYALTQSVSSKCPVLSTNGFNRRRAAVADGNDDCLEMQIQPFPRSAQVDIWANVSQDSDPVASTAVRHMFSYGGDTYDLQLRFGRSVASGANQARGEVGAGNSSSNTSLASVPVFDGIKVARMLATGNLMAVGMPPSAMDNMRNIYPNLGANRSRIFASSNFTAGNYWQGKMADLVVTEPTLTAKEALSMQAFLLARGVL